MKKITYTGLKEPGKPFRVIHTKLFRDELEGLPPGRYSLTVEKKRKNKSQQQLGYLFAVVYPLFLKYANDAGYEFTYLEEVDLFCKQQFAGHEVVNRHSGEIVVIPALKREFTTIDMMTYVAKIRDYCAEYLNGYIPEPGEQTEIKF